MREYKACLTCRYLINSETGCLQHYERSPINIDIVRNGLIGKCGTWRGPYPDEEDKRNLEIERILKESEERKLIESEPMYYI